MIAWYLNDIIIVDAIGTIFITTSHDNSLSAGDSAEVYELSAITGLPRNYTVTIHTMARLVSINVVWDDEMDDMVRGGVR